MIALDWRSNREWVGQLRRFFFLVIAAQLFGCSSLLYYPSRNLYSLPVQNGFQEKDVWIPPVKDSTHPIPVFGWYFEGRNRPPNQKSRGCVVQFHGNGENLSSHYLSLVWLVDHGYDLLSFDYPGYGRSEGEPTPLNTVEAGVAALEYAWQQDPSRRLFVAGQSLGGAVAAKAAQVWLRRKAQNSLAGIFIEGSFASYRRIARKVLARNPWTFLIQWLPWIVLSDSQAPLEGLSSLQGIPMLFIHSKQDRVVEYDLGQEFYEFAPHPKAFWSLPKGNHLDTFTEQHKTYAPKLLEFLKQPDQVREIQTDEPLK